MSDVKYKHNEGERIYFDLDGKIKGFGRIRGATTDDLPPIGRSWIIELIQPSPIDSTVYPFSCISVFECQIKDPPIENPPRSSSAEGA
jgi:hypothetical protein